MSVEYDVVSGVLVAGHYWFDKTMTIAWADTLLEELKRRYGDTETTTEHRITWMIGDDEEDLSEGTEKSISIFPAITVVDVYTTTVCHTRR